MLAPTAVSFTLDGEFSPDGRHILTVPQDGTARVWDAESGGEVFILPEQEQSARILEARYAAGGRRIVTGDSDYKTRLWDAENGQLLTVLPGVFKSLSGNRLRIFTFVADDETLQVFDADGGGSVAKPLKLYKSERQFLDKVESSPDGRFVIRAFKEDRMSYGQDLFDHQDPKVYDTLSGKPLFSLSMNNSVMSARFSGDGKSVLTSSWREGSAILWDATTAKKLWSSPRREGERLFFAVLSPDSKSIVTSGDAGMQLSEWVSHTPPRYLYSWEHGGYFIDNVTDEAIFSPDNRWLMIITDKKEVEILDASAHSDGDRNPGSSTGYRPSIVFRGNEGPVTSAAFSSDARRLLTTSNDGTARVLDFGFKMPLGLHNFYHQENHWSVEQRPVFSPDGSRAAVFSYIDDAIRLWDTKSGIELKLLGKFPPGYRFDLFFTADSRRLIAFIGEISRIFDSKDGREIMVSKGNYPITSPNGRWLVTTLEDRGSTVFWNVATGEELQELKGNHPRFSGNNKWLVTELRDEHMSILWDVETRKELGSLQGDSLVFSPDSRWLVTDSGKGASVLWDARTRKELRVLPGNDPTFSSDGRRLTTVAPDGGLVLWDVEAMRRLAVLQGSNPKFSPDNRLIVTHFTDIDQLVVWDAHSGVALAVLFGELSNFSQDGQRIIVNSWNGHRTSVLIDAVAGKEIARGKDLEFSPDGQLVFSRPIKESENYLIVLDSVTGKEQIRLEGVNDHPSLSSDGRHYLTSEGLWDAKSGERLAKLGDDGYHVHHAVFSPDGRNVVTTSFDGTVRIWPIGWLHERGNKPINVVCRAQGSPTVTALTAADITAVPILQGLQGEDVCAWTSLISRLRSLWHNPGLLTGQVGMKPPRTEVQRHDLTTERESTVPATLDELVERSTATSLGEALERAASHPMVLAKLAMRHIEDQPERDALWADLARRNADTESPPQPAARDLADFVLVSLVAYGELDGQHLTSDDHATNKQRYVPTPKAFDPPTLSPPMRQAMAVLRGDGVKQNIPEAMAKLRHEAARGGRFAEYQVARAKSFGVEGPADEKAACAAHRRLSETETFPQLQNSVGYCYQYAGLSDNPDWGKARFWYEKAAASRYPFALRNLGTLYQKGQGVPRDFAKARDYYRQAAELGEVGDAYNLAEMLAAGEGGDPDPMAALDHYRRAAELGSTAAMLALGARAELGVGVPQSFETAAEWYRKAADAGDANGQFKRGSLILDGKIQTTEPAMSWFRRAAEQGSMAGRLSVAWCFEKGLGGAARDSKAAREVYRVVLKTLGDEIRWRPYLEGKLAAK